MKGDAESGARARRHRLTVLVLAVSLLAGLGVGGMRTVSAIWNQQGTATVLIRFQPVAPTNLRCSDREPQSEQTKKFFHSVSLSWDGPDYSQRQPDAYQVAIGGTVIATVSGASTTYPMPADVANNLYGQLRWSFTKPVTVTALYGQNRSDPAGGVSIAKAGRSFIKDVGPGVRCAK